MFFETSKGAGLLPATSVVDTSYGHVDLSNTMTNLQISEILYAAGLVKVTEKEDLISWDVCCCSP